MASEAAASLEILIVDDEPGDVELTRLALAEGRFTCNVTVAGDGEKAMAFLRKQPPYAAKLKPDLVLLDLNMPRKNGREVLFEMKADPMLSLIPVVVLTTSDAERDVVASYRLGAAGYVTKPADIDTLFQMIRGIEEYWFGTVRRPA